MTGWTGSDGPADKPLRAETWRLIPQATCSLPGTGEIRMVARNLHSKTEGNGAGGTSATWQRRRCLYSLRDSLGEVDISARDSRE